MTVFSVHINNVTKMIAKYGQTVTFRQIPSSIPNPAAPWEMVNGTPVDYSVKILFLAPTATGEAQFGKELLQYLSGTETGSLMLKGYMAPGSFTPKKNDCVIRGGKELKIKALDTLEPNGTPILHTLEFE